MRLHHRMAAAHQPTERATATPPDNGHGLDNVSAGALQDGKVQTAVGPETVAVPVRVRVALFFRVRVLRL